MKRILSTILCLMSVAVIWAAASPQWEEANKLYAAKQYKDAAQKYEEILQNEGFSAELYYNLGNAYYKSNEVGLAILNYERALRLKPMYADAQHNLEFVNRRVIDKLDDENTFFLRKWFNYVLKLRTPDQWLYIAGPLFVLSLAGFLMFVFGKTRLLRKGSFYAGLLLLIFSVIFVGFSTLRKGQLENHNQGIILSGAVVVKGSPDKSGTDLFQLHEGTRVEIVGTLGEWNEIRLSNGNVGWLEMKHLGVI